MGAGGGWGEREAQGREDPRKRESTRRRGSRVQAGCPWDLAVGLGGLGQVGTRQGRLLVATGETRHQKCISHFLSRGR